VIDRLDDGEINTRFTHTRRELEAHGTGCTLSSAIAAQLCMGQSIPNACQRATNYIAHALGRGYPPGRSGVTVLNHIPRFQNV